jgi:hypothetical protein
MDIFVTLIHGGKFPIKAHTCAPLRRQTSIILSILSCKNVQRCPLNGVLWCIHNSQRTGQDQYRKLRLPGSITSDPREAERLQCPTILT